MKQKPKQGIGLHQFVATGGKPKDYQGSKGITPATVNNSPNKNGKK